MSDTKPKPSRSGAPWTATDRAKNGDLFVQVRFSGRKIPGEQLSDADMLRVILSPGEKPTARLRRLVREAFGRG